MKTATLGVRAPEDPMAGFVPATTAGKPSKGDRISFASPELLWRVLTAKRWELLKAMCAAGPLSVREAARRVGRDVKAVHGDLAVLFNAGVLVRHESGRLEFPYQAVKVEFLLQAASLSAAAAPSARTPRATAPARRSAPRGRAAGCRSS